MMVVPVIRAKGAVKGAETVSKALTGDIYTREWETVTGTGRSKHVVRHQLRVNPVSIGLGAVAGTLALGAGAFALWVTQRNVTKTLGKEMVRVVEFHHADPDKPETWYWIVKTERGIPILRHKRSVIGPIFNPNIHGLTKHEKAIGYYSLGWFKNEDFPAVSTTWFRFKTPNKNTFSIGERKGFLS